MWDLSHRTQLIHAIYTLDESPHSRGAWVGYVSGYVGGSNPITQFNCVPVLKKQLLLATTMYFFEQYVTLAVIAQQINRDML